MKKILTNRIFQLVVIIICVGVIVYEGIALYRDNKEYNIADSEYDTLVTGVMGGVEDTEEVPPPFDPTKPFPNLHVNYSMLKNINEDFTAWIYYPYLGINYPVVHEHNVNEYLHLTFDGTENKSGCLFTDVMSTEDFSGYHDMIFGHNMRNGSMFGQIKKLGQSDESENVSQNPYIYIYTPDCVYQYKIFAYYVTSVGSDAYSVVTNNEEYDTFVSFIKSHTIYTIPEDIDFSEYPSILTLSTCNGQSGSGRRFVIHSIKVNAWEN